MYHVLGCIVLNKPEPESFLQLTIFMDQRDLKQSGTRNDKTDNKHCSWCVVNGQGRSSWEHRDLKADKEFALGNGHRG